MAAFTVAIIMADIWFWRSSRVITHLFLGGITTTLLVFLCQRGYEVVNWAFLALIVVFIFLSKLNIVYHSDLYRPSDYRASDYTQSCECDRCGVPASSCSCVPPPVQPVKAPVKAASCNKPKGMLNYGV